MDPKDELDLPARASRHCNADQRDFNGIFPRMSAILTPFQR